MPLKNWVVFRDKPMSNWLGVELLDRKKIVILEFAHVVFHHCMTFLQMVTPWFKKTPGCLIVVARRTPPENYHSLNLKITLWTWKSLFEPENHSWNLKITLWTWKSLFEPENHSLNLKITLWTWKSLLEPENHSLNLKITLWTWKSLFEPENHSLNLKITLWTWKSLFEPENHSLNLKITLWTWKLSSKPLYFFGSIPKNQPGSHGDLEIPMPNPAKKKKQKSNPPLCWRVLQPCFLQGGPLLVINEVISPRSIGWFHPSYQFILGHLCGLCHSIHNSAHLVMWVVGSGERYRGALTHAMIHPSTSSTTSPSPVNCWRSMPTSLRALWRHI